MNLYTLFPAVALHGTVLVCAAGAVWLCLRRQSAARVSAGGRLIMAAALLLAAGDIILADWRARDESVTASPEVVLPAWSSPQPGAVSNPLPPAPSSFAGDTSADVAPAPVSVAAVEAPPAARQWELPRTMALALTFIWLAGALLIVVRWVFALAARRRWQRHASPVEDAEWLTLLHQIPGGRGVKLLQHPDNSVPCAWRGVILLPGDADAWPAAQRRMVLAHECAHLRRRDPLWLALGQWFLVLQWFNPLAWCVVRRCRLAAERAVDDEVLTVAGDAPGYADLLVASARAFAGSRAAMCSMASRSTVGRRVECILDETADRSPVRVPWLAASAGICAAMAAGIVLLIPRVSLAQEMVTPAEVPPAPAVEKELTPNAEAAQPDSDSSLKMPAKNSVVKTVNGRPILQSEVDDLMRARLIELRRNSGSTEEFRAGLESLPDKTLDWLIDQELILAEFQPLAPQFSAKINARVEEVIQKQFIAGVFKGDQAAFEAAIAESGVGMKKLREQQRKNVIVELMQAGFARPDSIPITAEQRAAWLKKNEAKLRSADKLKLWSLTIPGKTDGKTKEEQSALAKEIRDRLAKGADFATLARSHSVDSKRDKGGEWGWVEKTDLNEHFWPAISKLPAGEISGITPFQGNLYLFRVESREEGKMKPKEEVDAAVEQGIMRERLQEAAEKWLQELRRKAKIR